MQLSLRSLLPLTLMLIPEPIARKTETRGTQQKFIMNGWALIPGISRYVGPHPPFPPTSTQRGMMVCPCRVPFTRMHRALFFLSCVCNYYKSAPTRHSRLIVYQSPAEKRERERGRFLERSGCKIVFPAVAPKGSYFTRTMDA